MDMDRKILRLSTAFIVCALVVRLLSSAQAATFVRSMDMQRVGSVLLFLHTGLVPRRAEIPEPTEEPEVPIETTLPASEPTQPKKLPVVFTAADSQQIAIKDGIGWGEDKEELLRASLDWELTGSEPTVLILHTHGSESYTGTEEYQESSAYRTLDTAYNMVSVGDRVAELLDAAGIGVVHDRTLHDYPSYSGSYEHARQSLREYLDRYPSIRLVLDLHRDAAEDASGKQICYTVDTPAGTAAKLMLVIGSNAGGLEHPDWQENLALGAKLQVQLEKLQPGICRPISLRTSRFNQDLSPGALLVEVGAAGNTRQEALVAAEILAGAIIELSAGSIYEKAADST